LSKEAVNQQEGKRRGLPIAQGKRTGELPTTGSEGSNCERLGNNKFRLTKRERYTENHHKASDV